MNVALEFSPSEGAGETDVARLLRVQRQAFLADMNPSRSIRLDRLNRLERMLERDEALFCNAITQDYGSRARIVTVMAEINPTLGAIRRARRNLSKWMKPRRVGVEWAWLPGRAKVVPQPLGVVGIIAPWNYPLQLTLKPLVGALAAGNRAIIKPSELTPRLSEHLKRSVGEFFAEDEVAVVTGGADVAKELSELPVDHLVFTGSTAVGRMVAQAAAKNLTPVTLELGGKSPAIIDKSANLKITTERLVFAKLMNSGQTCIAPDYALVPRAMAPDFVEGLRTAARKQYPTLDGNPDYASIISDRHFRRIRGLVDDAREKGAEVVELVASGRTEGRIVAPTVLLGVTPDMAVMQEEIFGPVLPVLPYDTLDEALAFVNGRDRPLALYWFGSDASARERVLSHTISGGVTINDSMVHFLQEDLPFGGVGPSGQGQYHGEYGFRSLSKEKPIFYQSRFSVASVIYPPYTDFTRRFVEFLKKIA